MNSYHLAKRINASLVIALLAFGGLIHAQGGEPPTQIPTCVKNLNLVDEAANNPCETLFSVMTSCATNDGQQFNLTNLASQSLRMYPGPTNEATSLERCQCTELGYNLYSACAACQSSDEDTHWLSHDKWFLSCTSEPIPHVPSSISTTGLSKWMTQLYDPIFTVASALSVETGGPLIPPSATVTGSAASPSTNGSSASSSATQANSSSNTPVIVGSVIGGIAFIAILALIAFFYIRRRQKQRTAPSAEFMKYASAREPLRTHSRANTAEEEGHAALMSKAMGHGYAPHRGSVVRVDSPDNGGGVGDIEMGEGGSLEAPPAFTPGLFKDPIFEKGVALNLAAASNAGPGGPYGASPVTYSPATPSTAHAGMERQGLIHGRQGTE